MRATNEIGLSRQLREESVRGYERLTRQLRAKRQKRRFRKAR